MEIGQLPQRGTSWRTPRGSAAIWLPAPNVLLVRLHGYGEAQLARPICEGFDRLKQAPGSYVFFDAETMSNYDSGLRVALTTHVIPERERISAFHVLVRSKLVAMGASVASLALGGLLESTTDRQRFRAELDARLIALGVPGFSSAVLDIFESPAGGARDSGSS